MVIHNYGDKMIYTLGMKKAVRSIKPPHEFVIDIVEYDLDPQNRFIAVRFYESQWSYYNESERIRCVAYLEKIRKALTSFGVKVTLEPVIDTGDTLPSKLKTRGNGFLK